MTISGSTYAKLTKSAAAAALSVMAVLATQNNANAESYLNGQHSGLQKCVRAILGGYEVKHVQIRGHDFNCKGMKKGSNGKRTFQISHDQFGNDDQVHVSFRVNSLNVLRPKTLAYKKKDGMQIFEFDGIYGLPNTYEDTVDRARRERARKRRDANHWFEAVAGVISVTVAELGNPENRGTAPKQVSCKLPTFHVYDNFGGRAYTAKRGEYANIHKDNRFQGLGDAMSSLCVPRGFVVHFFEHDSFRGRMWEVAGGKTGKEYYDLGRQKRDFQDTISSFKVFENTRITGGG